MSHAPMVSCGLKCLQNATIPTLQWTSNRWGKNVSARLGDGHVHSFLFPHRVPTFLVSVAYN